MPSPTFNSTTSGAAETEVAIHSNDSVFVRHQRTNDAIFL